MPSSIAAAAHSFMSELVGKDRMEQAAIIAAAIAILTVFDTEELFSLLLGAGIFLTFHASQKKMTPKTLRRSKGMRKLDAAHTTYKIEPAPDKPTDVSKSSDRHPEHLGVASRGPIGAAATPISAEGFDAEIEDLVESTKPTEACEATAQRVVSHIRSSIAKMFPTARVSGFVMARISKGSCAYAVAVPELEIVIDVDPPSSKYAEPPSDAEMMGWRKHILRKCASSLVLKGGFKFRRSAFSASNPKVTMLLPSGEGNISDDPLPISMCANIETPSHMMRLHRECSEIDARSLSVISLVRRWAKDRGVSHAARGNLPHYGWTVMAIYYLQRGASEGPILPSFRRFKVGGAASLPQCRKKSKGEPMTVSELFKDFFRFFCTEVDWQSHVVTIHAAFSEQRARHHGDPGSCSSLLVVEDPFDTTKDFSEGVTTRSFARMTEELRRAHEMCSAGASLKDVLDPYMPTDAEAADE